MLQHNIYLAVHGQIVGHGGADDTAIVFTYPTPKTQPQSWTNSMFDPSDARAFTPQGQDAFAFWSNAEGNYYAIIFPSKVSRNGRLMLAINIKGFMCNNGDVALRTLRSLKDYYINSSELLSNDKISALLILFDNSLTPDDTFYRPATKLLYKGYRVFSGDNELANMFTYPHQGEYSNYKCVYFVPCVPSDQDPNFKPITSHLRKSYKIADLPSGVEIEPRRSTITEGETLTIRYTKNGCLPQERKVVVNGSPSNGVYYDGNTIRIHNAKTMEIRFLRNISLIFLEKGTSNRISDVSVRLKGQQQSVLSSITIDEDTQKVELNISKTGYHSKDVTLGQDALLKGSVTIELDPILKQKKVEVFYPGNTSDTIQISFAENSLTANYLKKTSDKIYISRKYFETPKPIIPEESFWKRYYTQILTVVLGLFLVGFITLVLWFFNVWPFDSEEKVEQPVYQIENVGETNQPDSLLEADKQTDLDYLKNTDDGWDKSKLKTEDFRQLIDYIQNGQVKEAIEHPYNKENKVNGHWSNIVNIYNDIKGNIDDNEIRNAFMRTRVGSDIINVEKLHSEMVELKNKLNPPSETIAPNTAPSEPKIKRPNLEKVISQKAISTPSKEQKPKQTQASDGKGRPTGE